MKNTELLFLKTCLWIATAVLPPGCALVETSSPAAATESTPVQASEPTSGPVSEPASEPEQALSAPALVAIDLPSPNFDRRKLPISMIVIHYTAAPLKESLNVLRDGRGHNRVSSHYVVAEDGTVYRLVDESKRAWHAGVSKWKDITDVNSASVGIEIVNLGHHPDGRPRPYPDAQIEAVIRLCLDIQSRHEIEDVVGHSEVAPGRKIDPGELFPWETLAERGVRRSMP